MHVQHDTARCVVESCGAHYVMTAVKTNQPNLLLDLQGLDWERPEVRTTEHRTANKGHGRIKNRVHHVRDVSYHEDRSRVRTGHLPRNLACLNNLAISIVRIQGRFEFLPQAHRHYARRPQDAVRQLLNRPNADTPLAQYRAARPFMTAPRHRFVPHAPKRSFPSPAWCP